MCDHSTPAVNLPMPVMREKRHQNRSPPDTEALLDVFVKGRSFPITWEFYHLEILKLCLFANKSSSTLPRRLNDQWGCGCVAETVWAKASRYNRPAWQLHTLLNRSSWATVSGGLPPLCLDNRGHASIAPSRSLVTFPLPQLRTVKLPYLQVCGPFTSASLVCISAQVRHMQPMC